MATRMQGARVWATVAVFLAAIAVAAAGTDGRVTLFTFSSGMYSGQTTALVDVGSSVNFRCRVEYNASMRAPTVSLKKTFPNATSHHVSTNDDIDDVFNGPQKFTVNPLDTVPNGADVYEWTIKNVTVGDSGIYVCYTNQLNFSSASVSLNVSVEPTHIDFYINDEKQPPSYPTSPFKKSVTIGQKLLLRCLASGGNPYPYVTLLSGSTAFDHQTNQTATVRQDVAIPEAINRSTSVLVPLTMNKTYIGQPIVCTAGVKNTNALSYTVILVVDNVIPQFQCQDVMNYDPNQNSFSMVCKVFGPNVTSYYVNWQNTTKNMTIVGKQGVEIAAPDDGRYSLLVKPPMQGHDIWWTMTLNVNNAKTATDLTKNDYRFVAVNAWGQAVHTVNVQLGSAATRPPSVAAAGRLIWSTVGMMAALFCVVASAIFHRM